jgi:TRAP-type C4-dicarboxylate transport system permease small subunit
MKPAQSVLVLVLMGAFIFGCWGQYTQAGHQAYDEMDSIIPWAAFWISGIGLSVFVLIKIFLFFEKKSDRKRAKNWSQSRTACVGLVRRALALANSDQCEDR